jgi:serine/threonine protein phosphatase PrpC
VGDRYLLCTDGLHGYLDEGEVGFILGEGPLPDVTKQMIDVANDRGGKDNITALVVACSSRPQPTPVKGKKKKPPAWTKQIKRSR